MPPSPASPSGTSDDRPDGPSPGSQPDSRTGACPRTTAWVRLSSGTIDEAEEEVLLAHLAVCPVCPDRVARIPSGWDSTSGRRSALDDAATRRIVESIAASEPPKAPRTVLPPPVIPGLADLDEVGHGGMGTVYKAREERLGRTVAVKVLSGTAVRSAEGHLRAEREARILTRIAHPNIVQILYVTEADGAPAIVMEWIDGLSLVERRARAPLTTREAVGVVAELARAVSAVHACGIVHRDIKPANVLLAASPGAAGPGASKPVPKLVDFGLARPDDDLAGSVTRASVTVGTPAFMAPEQTGLDPALGSIGPATDIHALGALLYWLLCGRAPYEDRTTAATLKRAAAADAPRLSSMVPRVPADLATIVDRCLAQRPERRYRSADALADDLQRHLDGRPVHARPVGGLERVVKWARRRPALAALSASAALATCALVAGTAYHVRSLERASAAITASRDEALAAEERARQSFDLLTDSSAERLLSRSAALDDADRDHLRGIREQYRQWPLAPDAASGLRFRAAGLDRLSKIFLRLSWVDDALDSAAAASENLADLERLGLDDDGDRQRRLDLDLFRGGLLISTDRLDEAAAVLSAEIERLGQDGVSHPENARHLPGALSGLAIVESRLGRPEEASLHFRRALDLCDRLVAEAPDDAAMLRLALPVYFNAASTPSLGTDDERHAFWERLVALAEQGLARFATDRDFIGSSATMALSALADLDLARGRPDEALDHVRRRAALARRLAAEHPDSETFANESMAVASQAFRCHAALGRPGDAEEELAAAVAVAARAVAAEPAIVSRARVLAWLLDARAEMERALGRDEQAQATERTLLDAIRPWTEGPGADPQLVAIRAATRERMDAPEGDGVPGEPVPAAGKR